MHLKHERVVGKFAMVLAVMLVSVVLQITSLPVAADISESFEAGFGPWQKDMNYDPAYFDVSISSIMAFDGLYSVKMQAHGLPSPPYPDMSVWIERLVKVPPSITMDVGITFYINHDNASYGPEDVLTYFGDMNPSDYPDFAIVGQTPTALGWTYYNYQTTVLTPANGWLYAAVGFHNRVTGFKSFFFDSVNLTGVSEDFTPPIITNEQPLNQSIISVGRPAIGASYSDPSGIDTSGVLLKVDSTDVTPLSSVTTSDVTYTPPSKLFEGQHNVYLSVEDASGNRNKAIATWRFTVDTIPPSISNLDPANHSTVGVDTPPIAASYADSSGVNTSLVVLKVDGIDVSASATIGSGTVVYNPAAAMSQGQHDVYLSVGDKASPPNVAVATWRFYIDSLPPTVTNQQPAPSSTTADNTPMISADYTDASFVDISSVVLRVDGTDVTSSAYVTATYVRYTPTVALWEGSHSVSLVVKDASPVHNTAYSMWQFDVDSIAPNIFNLRPTNNSVTNDNTPLIGAAYTDTSGIDTSLVVLKVDSVNVTAAATVTAIEVTYTPVSPLADGTHDLSVEVRDDSQNHLLSTASWSFMIDTTGPVTSLEIQQPKHTNTTSGRTYVSSSTLLKLTADDGGGTGVQSIQYLYYAEGETRPSSYLSYSSAFSIPTAKPDGLIHVIFRSTDNLANVETENAVDLYLDNTAPMADIPGYDAVDLVYVNNPLAIIAIESEDTGSGVMTVRFGLDDSNCPTSYSAPFTIGSVAADGEHIIYYVVSDRLGNTAAVGSARIFLDTVAPTAEAGGNKKINQGATASFDGTASTDGAVGSGIVNYTWIFTYEDDVAVLYGAEPQFRFDTVGDYEVTLRVTDRAGNSGTDTMRVTFNAPTTPQGESAEFLLWVILVILAVVIAGFLIFLLMRRRKKEEKEPEEKAQEEEVPIAACAKCGRKVGPDDEFCPKCGRPLKESAENPE